MKHLQKHPLLSLLAILLVVSLAVNSLAMAASAEDSLSSSEIREQINRMEAQREENERQLRELEAKLRDNLTEMEAIVAQKNNIDQQIFLLNQQIHNTNEMIAAYNVLIADKQEELLEAEGHLAKLNEQNRERIRAMEEEGGLSYWSVLFKSNSFSDLLDRLNMIEEIAAADQRRLDEMRSAAAEVAAAQEELVAEKANLESVRTQLAADEVILAVKREAADQLLADLIATGEQFQEYIAQGERDQQQLMEDINDKTVQFIEASASESYAAWLEESIAESIEESKRQESIDESIRESIEESKRQTTYTSPSTGNSGGEVNSDGWCFPMERRTWITSAYGWRPDPWTGEPEWHNGIDLEADYGDKILAAKSGIVTIARWSDSAGWYVTINHGEGYTSTYMHLEYFVVSVGDVVTAGQMIGSAGTTGSSTGVHLHFGIYYDGYSVNPVNYVGYP